MSSRNRSVTEPRIRAACLVGAAQNLLRMANLEAEAA
jgi:hypothetical protein